ncbi:maleylpyruvate isomerase family mycothiol-dependent enzyme [Streptomyces sp. NPDC051940]|uniref:maleylpyruvate isomerase family mycothiol-dependent enzyme n=1 Tax=Streptomyces sp. NPDC051940 TaxID=3155675 RepID=UPI003417FDFD
MTVHPSLQPYIDAWAQSTDAISDLVSPLTDGEWHRPSGLPGWSIKDLVSHVIGAECEALGDPRPIHTLPVDLYHVKTDWGRYTEVQVDIRRHHTPPEITSELEYTLIRRRRQLRNEKRAPEAVIRGALGRETTLEALLRDRAFDVWVHEQDIRRALGQPGSLDTAGAYIARDVLIERLPKVVAKDVAAPPETVVVVDVTGPVDFMRTVRIDAQGNGTVDGRVSLAPTVTLTTDWETYYRLACGRTRLYDGVKVDGDLELGQAILRGFAVTP